MIFVHGCFWHGHACPRGARVPSTNRDYWEAKIDRNRRRDDRNAVQLQERGWQSHVVWECELRDPERLKEALRQYLT